MGTQLPSRVPRAVLHLLGVNEFYTVTLGACRDWPYCTNRVSNRHHLNSRNPTIFESIRVRGCRNAHFHRWRPARLPQYTCTGIISSLSRVTIPPALLVCASFRYIFGFRKITPIQLTTSQNSRSAWSSTRGGSTGEPRFCHRLARHEDEPGAFSSLLHRPALPLYR